MKLIAGLVLSGAVFFSIAQPNEYEILRLVEEVKKAPPEERYKVMNELKLKLRELNRHEREEMIRKVYRELKGEEHERFEHKMEDKEYMDKDMGEKGEEMGHEKEESVYEKMEDIDQKEEKDDHMDDDDYKNKRGFNH